MVCEEKESEMGLKHLNEQREQGFEVNENNVCGQEQHQKATEKRQGVSRDRLEGCGQVWQRWENNTLQLLSWEQHEEWTKERLLQYLGQSMGDKNPL